MSYALDFSDDALDGIEYHKKSGNLVVLKKLNILLNELTEHPRTGTGKPEVLKHDLSGSWSRKITNKHRLVYKINDEKLIVNILLTSGHYSDK